MAAACPVKRHIWRGFAGFGLLILAAIVYGYNSWGYNGWVSLGLVAMAAIFLRGCPVCWSFWLYEAVRDKKRAAQKPPASPDAPA